MAHLSDVDRWDADQLAHGWSVKVATEMLHEGQVSPMQFLTLCAEPSAPKTLATSGTCRRSSRGAASAGDNRWGGGAVSPAAGCDEILRLIDEALDAPTVGSPIAHAGAAKAGPTRRWPWNPKRRGVGHEVAPCPT